MPFLLALFMVVVLAFQSWVTFRLWRVDWFEKAEKVAQSKLIWCLPLLGAVMVYSVIADEDEPRGPTNHLRS
jgi:surface polysaccharide O-acyltransferase-like enzyme